jgi:hypothetical protein
MKGHISTSVKTELLGLSQAGKIHVRNVSTIPGADFKYSEAEKQFLLDNTGKTYTVSFVSILGTKARGQNITKKDGTKTSIPNGMVDIVCLATVKCEGQATELRVKMTLAEIAAMDEKGQMIIEAQILGKTVDAEGKTVDAGNLWVHAPTPASAERQIELVEKLELAEAEKGATAPKLQA